MRISDWSSDVCSSDLDDVAGLESIMMKAQSCRRDRSNTGCDRKWRWVGQASNQFRDSSRGTLNGLGRINQQKPCGQKKQTSILVRLSPLNCNLWTIFYGDFSPACATASSSRANASHI